MGIILHLSTVHPRSDKRIVANEATTLATNLPHKVVLMIADGKGDLAAERGQVSIHDLGLLGGRVRRAFIGPWRAFTEISKMKPDIIHFHDPELISLGFALKFLGYKVIYDVHEDFPRQLLSKHWLPKFVRAPVSWAASAVEWFCSRVFDAIVPATATIAGRFPPEKTVVIQNFPVADETSSTDAIPYAERPESFVYPGVIERIRGIIEIVHAFEILKDIPDARLDLAGTFSPPDFGKTLRALSGWSSVNYHGEVSRRHVTQLLGSARAGLVVHHPVPNEIDAQPIKLYEYMAAGIPVIASDFPIIRKTIDGAKCGLLVEPLDPNAIADAIHWILDHPNEAEAMGRRGRRAVEQNYNWSSEAAKIIQLYNKLLCSERGAP